MIRLWVSVKVTELRFPSKLGSRGRNSRLTTLTHVKVTRYKNGEYCRCCPNNVHVRPATEAAEIRHYRTQLADAACYPNRFTPAEVRCIKDLLEGLAD